MTKIPFHSHLIRPCHFHISQQYLFLESSSDMVALAKKVLDEYVNFSGQLINLEKSHAFFSKNIEDSHAQLICSTLGVCKGDGSGKYLGLPFMIGRTKKGIFDFLEGRVRKKISGWKEKYLSPAGKEVMIKSVIQAIPTYAMQCFVVPISVCNSITSATRKFWWAGGKKERGVYWRSWEQLCKSKGQGGMGFRDMHAFNLAMLGKQCWRLIKEPESLVARVLQAKYYSTTAFMNAELGHRPSFIWRSICEGRKVIQLGLRYRVGNGSNISIWDDKWLPLPNSFSISPIKRHLLPEGHVSDLIDNVSLQWSVDLLSELFLPYEIQLIQAIPLSPLNQQDTLIWHYNSSGAYTVRSGYKVYFNHMQSIAGEGEVSSTARMSKFWNGIWKLKVLPKVRIFLWRAAQGALQTTSNLHRRIQSVEPHCQLCGEDPETEIHALMRCPWLDELVTLRDEFRDWREHGVATFTDLLWRVTEHETEEKAALFGHLCWLIWKARCSLMYEGKSRRPLEIFTEAVNLTEEVATGLSRWMPRKEELISKWIAPRRGQVAIHVDASISEDGSVAIGIICRDHNGAALAYMAKRVHRCEDSTHAELVAILEGLKLGLQMSFEDVIVWNDSLIAVNLLNAEEEEELNPLFAVISDCKQLAMTYTHCSIVFVRRAGNVPAHLLAKLGLSSFTFSTDVRLLPHDILSATLADAS